MVSRPQNAWRRVCRFLISDNGPTAVEYAVILGLIFMVCFAAITLIGQNLHSSFSISVNSIQAAAS